MNLKLLSRRFPEFGLLLTALWILTLAPPARAQVEPAIQMEFTINGPVEFPGRVLDAGTYFIRRQTQPQALGVSNVIEVLDGSRKNVLVTALARPATRAIGGDVEPFVFYESAPGVPRPVRSWFLPGDYEGYDFIYPPERAAAIATMSKQPAPTTAQAAVMREEPAPTPAPEQAEKVPETPPNPPVEQVQPAPEPQQQAAMMQPAPETGSEQKRLPSTGGELPLLALIGSVLLIGRNAYRRKQ